MCCNCDEQFTPGHHCKKLFSLEVSTLEEEEGVVEPEEIVQDPKISIHALTRIKNFQTMHIKAAILETTILILVDSGSTHNFITKLVATQLGLDVKRHARLQVVMVNGEKEPSPGCVKMFRCRQAQIHLCWICL